jgi:CRISPR/Cas system-associated protein Csm6
MNIITTVGTSIFENYKDKNPTDKGFKGIYKDFKKKSDDYSCFKNVDTDDIEDLENGVKSWFKGNKNASAEITSILAIANEAKDDETIEVHLIATDTVLSVLAAELIKCWFNENEQPNIKVVFERPEKLKTQADSKHIIHKLSISSNKEYQEGFMNLIEVVSKLIDKNKKAKEETILNITGGYKAIIPIMTLLGQIKKVPLKYIYEESNTDDTTQLVEVGNLPIHIDWKILEPTLPFITDIFPFKDEIELIKECLSLDILNYKKEQKKITNGKVAASIIKGNSNDKKAIQLLEKIQVSNFPKLNEFREKNAKYWELMILMKESRLIDDNLDLTTIGQIIKEYKNQKPLGGTFLGHYIELFLFYYFSHQPKNNLIKNYSICLPNTIEGFYGKDKDGNIDLEKTGTYGVDKDGNIDLNKNDYKIGDIDLTFRRSSHDVFCEIKALGALTEIFERIDTQNDYYHQLKSRIVKYHNIKGNENKKLELFFLVYEFQFVEFQKSLQSKIEQFDTAKTVLQHISKLNDEFGDKCEFKIIGLQKLQPIHLAGAEKSLLEIKDEYHVWSEIKL